MAGIGALQPPATPLLSIGSYLVDDDGARRGRGRCGMHDRLLCAAQQRGRRIRGADVRRGACCSAAAPGLRLAKRPFFVHAAQITSICLTYFSSSPLDPVQETLNYHINAWCQHTHKITSSHLCWCPCHPCWCPCHPCRCPCHPCRCPCHRPQAMAGPPRAPPLSCRGTLRRWHPPTWRPAPKAGTLMRAHCCRTRLPVWHCGGCNTWSIVTCLANRTM